MCYYVSCGYILYCEIFFFFNQKTAYDMRISDWSSDVCSSDLGLSRKKTIGGITGRDVPADRIHGSVAAHLIAAQRGAMLLRVHDVVATVDALKVRNAVAGQPMPRTSPPPTSPRWPADECRVDAGQTLTSPAQAPAPAGFHRLGHRAGPPVVHSTSANPGTQEPRPG